MICLIPSSTPPSRIAPNTHRISSGCCVLVVIKLNFMFQATSRVPVYGHFSRASDVSLSSRCTSAFAFNRTSRSFTKLHRSIVVISHQIVVFSLFCYTQALIEVVICCSWLYMMKISLPIHVNIPLIHFVLSVRNKSIAIPVYGRKERKCSLRAPLVFTYERMTRRYEVVQQCGKSAPRRN